MVEEQILARIRVARQAHEVRHPLDRVSPEELTAKWNRLVENRDTISVVLSQSDGSLDTFAYGSVFNAPPVYDPQGPVCFVEFADFGTGENPPRIWAMLQKAARKRGAVLLIAVCSVGDTSKETALTQAGFTVASEWYFRVLPFGQESGLPVRRATPGDVPEILRISDRKRDEYETYQPVFWRKARGPFMEFAPYMTGKVQSERTVGLVCEEANSGELSGFLLAEGHYIDDYAVARPELWATVGEALLVHAARLSHEKGEEKFVVVCGAKDIPKRTLLRKHGFDHALNWYTLPLIQPPVG